MSIVRCWLDLSVSGNVSANNIRVKVSGIEEQNLGYKSYGSGSHRLAEGYIEAPHNSNGDGTASVSGYFYSGIGNWDMSGSIPLTHINRQSTINSFTGSDIKGEFAATYTATSSSYENRLRISIPNVIALERYANYASGTPVHLSAESINYIRNYTNNKTIRLGGVIETWNGTTKVGESQELFLDCNIQREVIIRVNGTNKKSIPYIRVNGNWKESTPYIRASGSWKEES